MSIASEITRLQTSKADIKAQVNIDVDDINEGTDFIDDETLDDYADLIENMQDAYKQYIPIYTKMIAKGDTNQNGTPTPTSPVEVKTVTGEQVVRVCKKNLFDKNTEVTIGKYYNGTGDVVNDSSNTLFIQTFYINVLPNTRYNFSANGNDYFRMCEYAIDKTFIQRQLSNTGNTNTYYFITSPNTYFIRVSCATSNINSLQIEKGTSVTTYEAYQGKDYEVNLGKNLLDQSKLRQGAYHGRDSVQNRLFIDANYYLSPGTYTFFSNFDTSRYRVGVVASPKPYPNEIGDTIYDSGWKTNQRIVFTIQNSGYLGLSISTTNGTDNLTPNDMSDYWFMVCKGSYDSAISYSPYFTPIELNKIGDYQDFIRKGTGKNLYVGYDNMLEGFLPESGTYPTTNSTYPNARYFTIEVKKGESITTSQGDNANGRIRCIDKDTNQVVETIGATSTNNYYTSTAWYNNFRNGTIVAKKDFIIGVMLLSADNTPYQIEKGTTATFYEPYGYKDKWYIEKNVGKVVLNGTEINLTKQGNNNRYGIIMSKIINNTSLENNILTYCNYYESVTFNNRNTNNTIYTIQNGISGQNAFYINNNSITTLEDFKTWLTTHNTTIYYVLAIPTYTLIENEELLNQLEAVQLKTGENNVLVSGDLPMILDLSKYIQIAENHL